MPRWSAGSARASPTTSAEPPIRDGCAVRFKDFYADPKRAGSEEVNFGSAWQTARRRTVEVVWLIATGELVAFREVPRAGWPTYFRLVSEVLRMLSRPGRTRPDNEVVVIGVEPDVARLPGAVTGWEQHMPEENGLARLAERVDELSHGHAG